MNNLVHEKIEIFFSSYTQIKYARGQIIIYPGDYTEKVYHILSGRVCMYDVSYRGDEIIVNTFKSPAFFPMAQIIIKNKSKFFYKAETDSLISTAPAADVVAFLQNNPDVAFDLLARVYIGVDTLLERALHLMSGTAKSRLIFELIIEFRRFGQKTANLEYVSVSEASIASRSGLSRETINREMKHLKEKGFVEIKSHRIYIKNIAELERQLGSHV